MVTTQSRPPHRVLETRGDRGVSLIELLIATILLLWMAHLVATMTISGSDSQRYAARLSRVTEINQDIVGEIVSDVRSSVRLFTNDTNGTAYLGVLDRGTLPTPLASQLPALDSNGVFEPDTASVQKTGNQLFFARHAWTDEFETTAGNVYRTDVYRLVWYYQSIDGSGPQSGAPDGLNFCRYVSEPMCDGEQVDAISNLTDQSEVLLHLLSATPDRAGVVHPEVEVVWNLGQDLTLSETLRQIDSTGGLVTSPTAPRSSPWSIVADIERSSIGMLYYRHHSVATNYAPTVMQVAEFGLLDNAGDGFPHGFEVQIVGPAAARQVLTHLTLVSTNRDGHRAFHDLHAVTTARDL